MRFIRRLPPFKLEVQKPLLEKYGFPPTPVGLKLMERAIAQHMADPEVGESGKKLMIMQMGEIYTK